MIIDGNDIADSILKKLRKQLTPERELAAVIVGSDAASLSFLRQKQRTAETLGVKFRLYQLDETWPQSKIIEKIEALSVDSKVGGIIVQLPLPAKFDRVAVLNAIGIAKDVDVLNGENTKILAPAAGAVEAILASVSYDISDKKAVVVGSGLLIGRPVINYLMKKVRRLTIMNRGAYDPAIMREADIVVTGTGEARLVRGEHLKQGALVIDFGYGRDESDELAGDVDFKSAQKVAGYITPTPGGTGPIVVAMLFANFYRLAG